MTFAKNTETRACMGSLETQLAENKRATKTC